MNTLLAGFVIGISSSLVWPQLPGLYWTVSGLLLSLLLFKYCRFVAAVIAGAVYWMLFSHHLFNTAQVPDAGHFSITGVIKSLPQQRKHSTSFIFDIERLIPTKPPVAVPVSASARVRLNWYGQHPLQLGQRWQLKVRLKPLHGLANQGGFNYQRYLVANHIAARGSVTGGVLLSDTTSLRAGVVRQLAELTEKLPSGALLRALAVADKTAMAPPQWQILQRTGTGHLFAISGLHLGVVAAGGGGLLLTLLNLLSPLTVWGNKRWALGGAMVLALCYAYLAGFSLPTQRALVMLLVATGLWFVQQRIALWELLLWALACVLLVDPLALLSAGTWLSFVAVTVIFVLLWRWPLAGEARIKQLVWLQLLMFPGLLLVQGLWFGGVSLVAPLLNLILIPWVSIVVIPLLLLAVVALPLPMISGWLLQLADGLIRPAWWLMSRLAEWPMAWLGVSQQWQLPLVLMTLLLVWVVIVPVIHWRWAALLLLPLPLAWQDRSDHWSLHFLAVGQGSALVIQQGSRGVIVDTGNSVDGGFSVARQIIAPFLTYRGIDQVDYLLLSHLDSDHAAGAPYLLQRYPALQLISNQPPPAGWPPVAGGRLQLCRQFRQNGLAWQGLSFHFLSPDIPVFKGQNNNSCVVRITDGKVSLLLPGDIEKQAEKELVQRLGAARGLRSDFLLAPHHGSRSSSTPDFVAAVDARHVIFSSGFRNRWQLPHPQVVSSYRQRGSEIFKLAHSGQLSVDIFPDGSLTISNYRQNMAPFWYNREL